MENIVIIDCGSQFNQLIARRVRELKTHNCSSCIFVRGRGKWLI